MPARTPGSNWRLLALAGALLGAVLGALSGCASRPAPGAPPLARGDRDGAEASPPANLHLVPDAEPRIEAERSGGPNKPYEVLGQRYTPELGDPVIVEQGLASWYGLKYHGRPTSSGEVYDMYAMTAAHRTMPLPSYVRVRNPANGREVVLRVNDRGPFHPDRVIDLSYTAAWKLGLLGGVAPVQVERITQAQIRSGNWRSAAAVGTAASPPAPAGGGGGARDTSKDPSGDPLGDLMQRAAGRPSGR